MKISIRVSILSLFTALLVFVGASIIALNYFNSQRLIFDFATKLLNQSSDSAERYIYELFEPVKQRVNIGANLIKHKVLQLRDSDQLIRFLLQNIVDSPNLHAVYWADVNGDMYLVEREQENRFCSVVENRIHNNSTFITKQRTIDGKVVGKTQYAATTFDPRVRPWYLKALKAHKPILSDVYVFHPFQANKPILGITYAYPVYDDDNRLMGMLAIDIMLDTVAKFVNKLNVSEHAVVCIFDKANNILASSGNNDIVGVDLPKIDKLSLDWVRAAFAEFHGKKSLFSYTFAGARYLAFYDDFVKIAGNDWFIGIILPVSDLVGVLHKQVFIEVLVTVVILSFGLLLVWFIANAISRPIIELAKEAKLITKLEITNLKQIKSRIKEIMQMQDAFDNMKHSLRSFACYVPIKLVKKIIVSGQVAQVGGENKSVTFLFSDLTGFTSLAEKLPPMQLMQYLSEYLHAMTQIIQKHNGTVDKYIGDAVMAFWGAPANDSEHALHACNAALDMVVALDKLNQDWLARGLPQIQMRIGINTGFAVIGNIGSEDRLSYTAVGDSVNLANRLEEINKTYATTIVISQHTNQLIQNNLSTRLLDYVMVRGKAEKVYIYELLPAHNIFADKLVQYSKDFAIAFADYQQGKWEQAIIGFKHLVVAYPLDKVANIYIDRCNYAKNNPPKEWDGVWKQQ